MIQTVDAEYATDYAKPIKSCCFHQKSSKIAYV